MNKITAFHKTLLCKFLKENDWVEHADNESGSTYYALKEDKTIKFRISDHFFAAFYDKEFQIILSDLQPNVFVMIINGNSFVCNSLKEVKSYISSISVLYRCSSKYFMSKNISSKDPDVSYWKDKYDNECKRTISLTNKLTGGTGVVKQLKTQNESLKRKNEALRNQIAIYNELCKKYKEKTKDLNKKINSLTSSVSYKITKSIHTNEHTLLSNVGQQ